MPARRWPVWLRWSLLLALPALVIGVGLYPDIHAAMMPAPVAIGILLVAAGAAFAVGRPHLLILLPVLAACLPSRQAGFAAYLLAFAWFVTAWGGRRLVRPLDGIDLALLGVILWSVATWIINLGVETDLWSLPVFALTLLSPWLLLFVARAGPWSDDDRRGVIAGWLALTVAQLAPVFLKPPLTGTPGAYLAPFLVFDLSGFGLLRTLAGADSLDMTYGTTPSAHHLGALLIGAMLYLVAEAAAARRRPPLLLLLALLYAFIMTDSKHLVLAGLVPGVVYLVRVIGPTLAPRARRALAVGLITVLAAFVVTAGAAVARVVVAGLWKPYAALAELNPKLQLVQRTGALVGDGGLTAWIGLGPGSYATRAATIRASDVLYKEGDQLPAFIPPHTGDSYRSVAYDLYTSAFVDAIRYQSGVLTSPFSSIIGIVAEFGILGTAVVGWFFWMVAAAGWRAWGRAETPAARAAGAATGFLIPFLLLIGLFDSYLEQPSVTAPIILLALVAIGALDQAGRPRTAERSVS
jgi:hypothetical protein